MSRLGGPNSNQHARIGGLTRSSQLKSASRSLAMRVRGGASGDTGDALTAALGNALAKRRRDSAPAAVKAGAAGLERDVVQSILRAIDAPPKSPSKSLAKKIPKGRYFDGASVLMTARRGQSLWGAVQIFAPHRGNAPHRGDLQRCSCRPTSRSQLARSSVC
ncbi:hypothetical protein M885DRAFT_87869 [Pelagophyceae sp. CCMP2097]|nr:hypothetical protein M885DRAFT_87869 [Pelagophyceae sp. CCMP2097]